MKTEKNTFLRDLNFKRKYRVFKTEYDVLVIDDESNLRNMLSETLEEAGFSIETAGDGYNALIKFLCHKYRLILTDMKMPRMNGLEIIKAIKNIKKEQPIMVLSGEDSAHLKEKTLDSGADVFLTKPVDMNELLDVIGKTIGKPY